MSYAARVANLGRPGCFSEVSEYDGESRECRGCTFRHDCEQGILAKQSRLAALRSPPAYQPRPMMPTPGAPTLPARPITPVAGSRFNSPPTYNFDKPLPEQIAVYVATSMAEAVLMEAQHLVVAIRENYRSRI